MTAYLSAVMTVSLLGAVVPALLPSGSAMKKYLGLALSVALLMAMRQPVSGLSSFLDALDDCFTFSEEDMTAYSASSERWLLSETDAELKNRLSVYAKEMYGLPLEAEDFSISYSDGTAELRPTSVVIHIAGKKITRNLGEFRHEVSERLLCECEINDKS